MKSECSTCENMVSQLNLSSTRDNSVARENVKTANLMCFFVRESLQFYLEISMLSLSTCRAS